MSMDIFLFEIILVSFLGLCLGSFATAITWRVPQGISWIGGWGSTKKHQRSQCTHCGHALSFIDLIPVFSWLFCKGKCRHCKKKIRARYLMIELLSLIACLCLYLAYGFDMTSVALFLIVPFLLALFFIDIDHFILPNQLVFIVGILAIFYHGILFFTTPTYGIGLLLYYGLSAVIFGLFSWVIGVVMSFVLKKDALGFGDVKFFAVSGLWLGISYLPYYLIAAGGIGVLWAVIVQIITKKKGYFPFGPALILCFFSAIIIKGFGIVPLVH